MIASAVVLGLAMVATFAIFLWKSPRKIRKWLLKRQLTLDAAFTAFCFALTIPSGALGPTNLMGIALAGLAWTAGLWLMKWMDTNDIEVANLLSSFSPSRLIAAPA